jgi:ankyrin repeat protein
MSAAGTTPTGTPVLHLAASRGDITLCVLLLSRGASVDQLSADGSSALHALAGSDATEVTPTTARAACELLVAARVPVHARRADGATALRRVRVAGFVSMRCAHVHGRVEV